ncbi:MAG: hypothetical protein ACR2G3_03590 [Solirubrobacterales bacterium]
MLGRGGGALLATAVIAAVTFLPVTLASAATTCSFDAGTRILSAGGDPDVGTNVSASPAAITVNHLAGNGSSLVGCSGPGATPANTDTVVVDHADPEPTTFSVNKPAAFAPGFTDEPLSPGEVEIEVDLGTGDDLFHVADGGLSNPNNWVLGTLGLDWNPGSLFGDVDIEVAGVEAYDMQPQAGDNVFTAQGSSFAGDPVTEPLTYFGGPDIDHATGGDGPDEMGGYFGADVLRGAGGADLLDGAAPPGPDKDRLLGGSGIDVLKAKDGRRDERLDCGPGKNSEEKVSRDLKKDPQPKSC